MKTILMWLTDRLPCRIISDEKGSPYLERYYLFSLLNWTFYVHRFVASDPDRGLHDHPWSKAYSIVLRNWYLEQRPDTERIVRWFNSLVGTDFHRVVLPANVEDVWTLFFHKSKRIKLWGFKTEDGYKDYDYKGFIPSKWWKTAKVGHEEPRRMK